MKKIFTIILVLFFSIESYLFAEKEALYYRKINNNTVQCELCPHRCILRNGQRGFCRVRLNRNGILYSLVFGKPCSVNVGPIEKAPTNS